MDIRKNIAPKNHVALDVHLTVNCDKPKTAQPKCVHCGEGHPASYRGCMVAKEIQKMKDKQNKKPILPKRPQRVNQQESVTRTIEDGRTYSQAASGESQTKISNKTNTSIEQTLQQILERLTKMDERITRLEYSAKGAIPKNFNVK